MMVVIAISLGMVYCVVQWQASVPISKSYPSVIGWQSVHKNIVVFVTRKILCRSHKVVRQSSQDPRQRRCDYLNFKNYTNEDEDEVPDSRLFLLPSYWVLQKMKMNCLLNLQLQDLVR